jgi:hypothetical protein
MKELTGESLLTYLHHRLEIIAKLESTEIGTKTSRPMRSELEPDFAGHDNDGSVHWDWLKLMPPMPSTLSMSLDETP